MTGDGYSYEELEQCAKDIRRELLQVKGVKRIIVSGGRDEVVNITLSKEKIARNGILPTQIMLSLQNAGKTLGAGTYTVGSDRVAFRIGDEIKNEDDVRNLLISTIDGKQIRIGDIAEVTRDYAEPQTNGFFVNGKPAMAICIAMNANAIVPDVGKAVDARLARAMQTIPVGISTEKIFFQPDKVDDAIGGFMVNLVESVLIVIIVLIFAMGFRSGVIIGVGLVLSIAVSFPILLTMGATLQRISLGAFIVAMGMLVDNSIVVLDGILVDKSKGYGPKTFLYRAGRNAAMPLLGATIIAASSFLGVYLSPDSAGEYAGDLFLVLCVSLLASWVLALVQVPYCAKVWLPVRSYKSQKDKSDTVAHRFVRRTVSALIGHKALTIGVAVLVLAASVLGLLKVKNMFFPDFDYNQFVVEYYLPEGTSPDKVKSDLMEMTDELLKDERIERVAACMGSAPAHYCLVRPMTNGGDSYGELIVDCKDFETVCEVVPELKKRLRSERPDAYIRLRKYNFSISTSHTVEALFSGPDSDVLRDLSAQAEQIMRESPYADPYSVQNNWKPKGKSLVAEYQREDALRCGIERGDLANALQASTDGMTVGLITDRDKMVLINMRVRNADGSLIRSIDDIPVWSTLNMHLDAEDGASLMTPGGLDRLQDHLFKSVPLSGIAKNVRMESEEKFIHRVNGQRAIEAECDHNVDIYEGTPSRLMQDIQSKIEAIALPPGYTLKWVGENDVSDEALGNIYSTVPLIVFLICGVLLLLFGNWRTVFLILMCIPFVLCGIVPTLLIFSKPFTFMAIIGFMGLMGMMVKNAIVLIDEINRLQKEENVPVYKAIVDASVSRVRPVLLASLTTILGMLPLANDPMYSAMSITIMAGLAVGTLITLVLLPVLYATAFKVKK